MKRNKGFLAALLFLTVFLFSVTAYTAPSQVNYQGRLLDILGVPVDGTVDIEFTIYNDLTAGSNLWTETQTGIIVTNGFFNTKLGTTNPLTESVFTFDNVWLEVAIDLDPPMTPRQKISSAVFALQANDADTVDGSHASDLEESLEIVDAIETHRSYPSDHHTKTTTFTDITSGQVTTGQMTNSSVTTSKLADNSVTSPKIVNGTILNADIGFNYAGSSSKGGAATSASSAPWSGLTGVPAGFLDGIDNTGILIETDPEVGLNTLDFLPKWDGSKLVTGSIFNKNTGDIGIGTPTPGSKLDVNGDINSRGSYKINAGTVLAVPGSGNLFVGIGAGSSNTTGNYNTANGFYSLRNNTTGNSNTSNGYYSLRNNTTGNSNTANGYSSLRTNTTGGANTANGTYSLYSNTTGSSNTANGSNSLRNNTIGGYNTANGSNSLYSNISGYYNTATGYSSLRNNTTGGYNTANGTFSLYLNTAGYYNTANGHYSLRSNTTGDGNTANGYFSLRSNTTGNSNTATGNSSLSLNTTGYYNTATGYSSLNSNTTGYYNTANGSSSLYSNTSGIRNTATGTSSLSANTTGNSNTVLGFSSGSNISSGSNNLMIGYNVDAPFPLGSYQMSIGNLIFGTGVNGSGTTLSTGRVGISINNPAYKLHVNGTAYATGAAGALSDRRHKKNIQPLAYDALDVINELRPVTYEWIDPADSGMEGTQTGFIAQEVEEVLPEFILTQDDEEQTKGLKYNEFAPLVVKGIQELKAENDELRAKNNELEARLSRLENLLKGKKIKSRKIKKTK